MPFAAQLSPLHRNLAARLTRRGDELRALLQQSTQVAEDAAVEVTDFKDAAAAETQAAMDEVATAHAAAELDQVVAALRRLREGTYGECLDCGEPIDERRLVALPATPYCTDCQALHEHPGAPRR
jgi:DnaK suppressor protein